MHTPTDSGKRLLQKHPHYTPTFCGARFMLDALCHGFCGARVYYI